MPKKVTELERLIREQESDARLGERVFPEPHVAFSLDYAIGENATLKDVLSVDFRMPYPRDYDGCSEHGKGSMFYRESSGKLECRGCKRETDTLKYATDRKFREAKLAQVRQFRGHNVTPERKARDAAYSRAYRARQAERRRVESEGNVAKSQPSNQVVHTG